MMSFNPATKLAAAFLHLSFPSKHHGRPADDEISEGGVIGRTRQRNQSHKVHTSLEIARRKDAKVARIKHTYCRANAKPSFDSATKKSKALNSAEPVAKFKIWCSNYLYTLVLATGQKVEKLKQSLPAGKSPLRV
ncbi:hypothetical protein BT69DRAFT_823080 [Atractiella rhizophila]|nr:hypothetical protein BT69DRAFT_823080 [Atractiella rhizophila]